MAFGQKILQFYHKVIRNKSRESCADKKLDHSPIVTYTEKGKTITLHQDLDNTDEMAELDGASSSSADVDTGTHVERQPFPFAELTVFLLQKYGLERSGSNLFLLCGLLKNFQRELR